MNVGQLRDKLSYYPDDMEILIETQDHEYKDIWLSEDLVSQVDDQFFTPETDAPNVIEVLVIGY